MSFTGFGGLAREAALGFAELAWLTRCVGCDDQGALLCEDCRTSLPWICQRWACPCCGAPFGYLTCTECKRDWPQRATVCVFPFGDVSARMATIFKDGHELRLAPVIAAAMATALDEASSWPAADGRARFEAAATDALCFVPATSKAFLRRGYDHMELVSRELSQILGIPLADVLVRQDGKDQRDLSREARAQNLHGRVEVVDSVREKRMLLIDDVITTGASTNACAEALLVAGARSVTVCALARVW